MVYDTKSVVVVVAAYNAEKTLGRCLEAIGCSKVKPLETIVVDDASTDKTAQVAREWPVTLLSMPHNSGGAAIPRNFAVGHVSAGDNICFIDADVAVLPDTIGRLIEVLEEKPECAVVSGVYTPKVEGLGFFGMYKNLYSTHKWQSLGGKVTSINSSTAIMRRDVFNEMGGFNESMSALEDAELGTRISQKYELWLEPNARMAHLHKHNFGSYVRDTFTKGVHIVAHTFERKKQANLKDMSRGRLVSFPFLEILNMLIGPAILVSLTWFIATQGSHAFISAGLLVFFLTSRASFTAFLFRMGGFWFGLRAMAFMVIDSTICFGALLWGLVLVVMGRLPYYTSSKSGTKFPWARFAAKWFHKYYIEQLVFFVTSRCNLKCNFCFYYEEIDASSKSRELKIDEIRQIAKSMWPFYILNIGGGEPFLRKELDDIVGAFIEHAQVRQVVIPTNAWYTKRVVKNVKSILTRYPHISLILVISIDGKRELHDQIRGLPGSYDHLIETYYELAEVRKDYPNLSLLTNTTLTHGNESQILDILTDLDQNYDFDDHIMGLVRFKSRDSTALEVSLNNYRAGIEFLLKRKIRRSHIRGVPGWLNKVLNIKDIMRYRVILDLVGRKKFTTPCYAGKLAVTINEEGLMSECEIRQTEIGQLREADLNFNKLFFTKKREEIAQAQMDEKCACTYECYLPFNILLNPMSPPRILKALFSTFISKNPEDYIFQGSLAEIKTTINNTISPPKDVSLER
jgi:MoaA/NifB/PqqE/SkfB family radical SAM enzyme/GT2 family glycosyltransferase